MTSLADQSVTQESYRKRYGGSDSTASSFNRPQYLKYNSLTKSRDFGAVDNLVATLTGVIGGHTGRSTLFFKVRTLGEARLRIVRNPLGSIDDKLIVVGIVDGDHNQVQLNDDGYGQLSPLDSESVYRTNDRLAPGTYYFTVSTNQWREIEFSVTINAQRFVELSGEATLSSLPRLRLALVKLAGAAGGALNPALRILPPGKVKVLTGPATGACVPRLTLVIMQGVATGRMDPYGRLIQNFRISGTALGSNANIATMTAQRPYGYGY